MDEIKLKNVDPRLVGRLAEYIGSLIGVAPRFQEVTTSSVYPRVTDNSRRREIAGPCRVPWKEGVRRVIAARHPELTLTPAADAP